MPILPPFEEIEHPRAPRGSRTGGQFVSKGGGAGGGAGGEPAPRARPVVTNKKTVKAAAAKVTKAAKGIGVAMTVVPMSAQSAYLERIDRTTGKPGAGAEALRMLTAMADQHGVELSLNAEANAPKLFQLYEGLGFKRKSEKITGPDVLMVRPSQQISTELDETTEVERGGKASEEFQREVQDYVRSLPPNVIKAIDFKVAVYKDTDEYPFRYSGNQPELPSTTVAYTDYKNRQISFFESKMPRTTKSEQRDRKYLMMHEIYHAADNTLGGIAQNDQALHDAIYEDAEKLDEKRLRQFAYFLNPPEMFADIAARMLQPEAKYTRDMFRSFPKCVKAVQGLLDKHDLNAKPKPVETGVDQIDGWKEAPRPRQVWAESYKLFNLKDGQLYPAMVTKGYKGRPMPIGKWITAEYHGKSGALKERPGFHIVSPAQGQALPLAPWMRSKKTGRIRPQRVWAKVRMATDTMVDAGKKGILFKPPAPGEYYPHSEGGKEWYIGGSIIIDQVLSDQEVAQILTDAKVPKEEIEAETHGDVETRDEEIVTRDIQQNPIYAAFTNNVGEDIRLSDVDRLIHAKPPNRRAQQWDQPGTLEELRSDGTEAICALGKRNNTEFAFVLKTAGTGVTAGSSRVMLLEGKEHSVDIPHLSVERMNEPGSLWDYDHYHPLEYPPSISDILALNKIPGMGSISSHDISGGAFKITLPHRTLNNRGNWREDHLEDAIHSADENLQKRSFELDKELFETENVIDPYVKTFVEKHARNLALANRGFINYEFKLSKIQEEYLNICKERFRVLQAVAIETIRALGYQAAWENEGEPESMAA